MILKHKELTFNGMSYGVLGEKLTDFQHRVGDIVAYVDELSGVSLGIVVKRDGNSFVMGWASKGLIGFFREKNPVVVVNGDNLTVEILNSLRGKLSAKFTIEDVEVEYRNMKKSEIEDFLGYRINIVEE